MYHRPKKLRPRLLALLAALVAALLLAAVLGFRLMLDSLALQSAQNIRTTVLQYAVQCYAVEGVYPPSLDYLESSYGLVLNHDRYIISYSAYASNQLPDVTVLQR